MRDILSCKPSLCGGPNRQHYGPCPCQSVCLSVA